MTKGLFLPAEWHKQKFVQLTWPHEKSDWAYMLQEVEECFTHLAAAISLREKLLIVAPDTKVLKANLTPMSKALASQLSNNKYANTSFIADFEHLYIVDAFGNKKVLNVGPSFCPALSPDGKKVVFNQMDDICVINIDGTGKRVLGRGFNPSWVNNNQIIYELTEDNGHIYTAGELYLMNVNDKSIKKLTATSNLIEMNACVSPDGNKVIFTSFTDGQIYIADFK